MRTPVFRKAPAACLVALFSLCAAAGCNQSQTVLFEPQTMVSPEEDLSTLMPQITRVYPGTLQTLDVPDPHPADIDPQAASIIVIFSEVMENSEGQIAQELELRRNDEYVPVTVDPPQSSNCFVISPESGRFEYGETYDLLIFKSAYREGLPQYTLNFEPLVQLPATTLNPVNPPYVSYRFTTAYESAADYEEPFVLSANPGHGDNDVDTMLSGTGGRIILTFYDNVSPMIYPPSVNSTTVTLIRIPSTAVDTEVSMETTDLNFKTYYVRPLAALENAATYILTISVGNSIQDFRSNRMMETTHVFSTAP